jgi:hypothetical protein
LIKSMRRLAYPRHPARIHKGRLDGTYGANSNAPASIPIFILRPLRGQLEHSTQSVVNRLRADGDKGVFWIDTSGWLEQGDGVSNTMDYFLDNSTSPGGWRLTEQGHQRVVIFLHMHVCSFLASSEESCAFLAPDVYEGNVFAPEGVTLDLFLKADKEKNMRQLFWGID